MRKTTFAGCFASAALFASSAFASMPVHAQTDGNGGNNQGCSQNATGGGNATGNQQGGRSASGSVLAGVIDAAIQDVSVLDNINAPINALNGANVQVVCLSDVLNGNDVKVLQDVLNGSPILSNDLNGALNNNNVLNDLLAGSNIFLLNNVQVVALNLNTGQIYVL